MSDENKPISEKSPSFWSAVKHYASRVLDYMKEARMEYIVMIALFLVDLFSKMLVNRFIEKDQTVTIIPYVLNFCNVHNYNAAFGADWMSKAFGDMGARIAFCLFAVAATVVFIFILIKNRGGNKLFRISLAMLAAGAMGNCVDRMALGYVRDFVQFVYFGLEIFGHKSFYVFNIADAELVVGVILIIVFFLFIYKEKNYDPLEKLIPAGAEDEPGGDNADSGDAEHAADGENGSAGEGEKVGDGAETEGDGSDGEDGKVDGSACDSAADAPRDGADNDAVQTESGGAEDSAENAEADGGEN